MKDIVEHKHVFIILLQVQTSSLNTGQNKHYPLIFSALMVLFNKKNIYPEKRFKRFIMVESLFSSTANLSLAIKPSSTIHLQFNPKCHYHYDYNHNHRYYYHYHYHYHFHLHYYYYFKKCIQIEFYKRTIRAKFFV